AAPGPSVPLSAIIAADDVADTLTELALAPPRTATVEVAGPEACPLVHQDYDHNDFEWEVTTQARLSASCCGSNRGRRRSETHDALSEPSRHVQRSRPALLVKPSIQMVTCVCGQGFSMRARIAER